MVLVNGLQYGCWCPPYLTIWGHIFVPSRPEESKRKTTVYQSEQSFPSRNCSLTSYPHISSMWNCSVLYEVFPMSFLMEQAGGQSFTGKQRVCFRLSVLFLRSQCPTEKSWCYKYHICIAENAPAKFTMQALELAPAKLHDRSPIFLGSYDDVEEIKALYASESTAWPLNYNKRVVKKSTAWSFCQRTRASFTRVDIHIVTVLIRYLLCSYIVLKNPLYGRARYSSIANTGLCSSQI